MKFGNWQDYVYSYFFLSPERTQEGQRDSFFQILGRIGLLYRTNGNFLNDEL